MAENSKIEWCNHTMNFWIGCQEVSDACAFCYARVQNEHWKWVNGWGPDGERRRTSASNWHKLRIWNRKAGEQGVRHKVFSNSLSDFFDNHKDVSIARREAWHYIEQSPNLDFLILTKRPQNIRKMLPDPETGVKPWGDGWPNVWLGSTVENQEEADRRIPHLLAVPAKVHFLSCEPLLGPVALKTSQRCQRCTGSRQVPSERFSIMVPCPACSGKQDPRVDWVIAGGESGPNARPPMISWVRSLRDQCAVAQVPFHFKQWGEYAPDDPAAEHTAMHRVGKKAAGALLDGREWREFPR